MEQAKHYPDLTLLGIAVDFACNVVLQMCLLPGEKQLASFAGKVFAQMVVVVVMVLQLLQLVTSLQNHVMPDDLMVILKHLGGQWVEVNTNALF